MHKLGRFGLWLSHITRTCRVQNLIAQNTSLYLGTTSILILTRKISKWEKESVNRYNYKNYCEKFNWLYRRFRQPQMHPLILLPHRQKRSETLLAAQVPIEACIGISNITTNHFFNNYAPYHVGPWICAIVRIKVYYWKIFNRLY
jgi:hypothetical protein